MHERMYYQEPMYVSVHELSSHATPVSLEQSYLVCELHDKLSLLWSFIKNHLKNKLLVFLQSCKQVRNSESVYPIWTEFGITKILQIIPYRYFF